MLKQLVAEGCDVKWMGVLPAPGGDDDGVSYVLDSLGKDGVDTSLRELISPPPGSSERLGVPTATIIVSAATGSRTIISSRRGLNCEVSPAWFGQKLPEVVDNESAGWIHLETRQYASVMELASEAL